MRILITGATGRVAAQLAWFPGVRPKALTRHPAVTVPGAETITGDLTDPSSLDLTDPEPVTGEIARLTGRPARTYEDWARDNAAAFGRRDR